MLLITTMAGFGALHDAGLIDTNEWRAAPMAWEDLREELEGAAADFDAVFVCRSSNAAAELDEDENKAYTDVVEVVMSHDVVPIDGIDSTSTIYPEEDVIWVRTDAGWVRYAGV